MAALLHTEERRCNDIVESEEARQGSAEAAMLGGDALQGALTWPLQMRAEVSKLQQQLACQQVRFCLAVPQCLMHRT